MSEGRVFEVVRTIIVDALGVDASEVTLEARLFADLGAESIDMLDISFRLEEELQVALPTGEWTELVGNESGQLSAAVLGELLHGDLGIELSSEAIGAIADLPLRDALDRLAAEKNVAIGPELRRRYAALGTDRLLERLGAMFGAPIDAPTVDRIVDAASACGFDEDFWSTVADVFTVSRLVAYVEAKLAGDRFAA
jgi:acyl carrier protein